MQPKLLFLDSVKPRASMSDTAVSPMPIETFESLCRQVPEAFSTTHARVDFMFWRCQVP